MLRHSHEAHIIQRLTITAAMLVLGTGLSSTANAQDGNAAFFEAPRAESQGAPPSSIEGTWILTIHRVTQGFSFTALQSFTAGGVTLATGTVDRTPPPPISPLYGRWQRTSPNLYSVAIAFFAFDSAGNAVAMIKTLETFQMVGKDNLIGSGTALACDLHGDNCVNANLPITITGKRLLAE